MVRHFSFRWNKDCGNSTVQIMCRHMENEMRDKLVFDVTVCVGWLAFRFLVKFHINQTCGSLAPVRSSSR